MKREGNSVSWTFDVRQWNTDAWTQRLLSEYLKLIRPNRSPSSLPLVVSCRSKLWFSDWSAPEWDSTHKQPSISYNKITDNFIHSDLLYTSFYLKSVWTKNMMCASVSFCLLTDFWPCHLRPVDVEAFPSLVLREVDVGVGRRPRPFFLLKLFVCSKRRNLTVHTMNWCENWRTEAVL